MPEHGPRPAADHHGGRRQDEFTAAFGEHYAALMAYGRRRAPEHDAEDIVAEAFAIAWRRWDDAPPGYVRPWLFSIARNLLANHYRSVRRRQRMVLRMMRSKAERTEPSPEAYGVARILRDDMRHALEALSDPDREVLLLAAWEHLGHAEIAQVLGCAPGTARVRLHRARQRLRAVLARVEEERGKTGGEDHGRRPAS